MDSMLSWKSHSQKDIYWCVHLHEVPGLVRCKETKRTGGCQGGYFIVDTLVWFFRWKILYRKRFYGWKEMNGGCSYTTLWVSSVSLNFTLKNGCMVNFMSYGCHYNWKNEVMTHAISWMNLKNMLCERSQTENYIL